MLIGNDFYEDFMLPGKRELVPGLYMSETKLGEMITGRIPGSHLGRQCPQPGSISFCQVQRSYQMMNQEASELISCINQETTKMEIVPELKSSVERDPDFQNPFHSDVTKFEEPREQPMFPLHGISTLSICEEGPDGSEGFYLSKRMRGRYSTLRKLLQGTARCRKFSNMSRRKIKPQEDEPLAQKSVPRRTVPVSDSQGSDIGEAVLGLCGAERDYLRSSRNLHAGTAQRRVRVTIWPLTCDILLIQEPNLPRGSWMIGRIQELIQSGDEGIRPTEILLSDGKLYTRAIKMLHPLEIPQTKEPER